MVLDKAGNVVHVYTALDKWSGKASLGIVTFSWVLVDETEPAIYAKAHMKNILGKSKCKGLEVEQSRRKHKQDPSG